MTDVAFECRALSKHFGGLNAIQDVSFCVKRGTVSALIGPNGAGKTTLFNVATNVTPASKGEVLFFGREANAFGSHQLAQAGVVRTFQSARVFPGMTTLDNVLSGAHLGLRSGLLAQMLRSPAAMREESEVRAKAEKLLGLAGLGGVKDRLCSDLSIGAQKLTELLRAIMARPRLLLLDEPAAGLNDSETAEMALLLRALCDAGMTIVLVEHNMSLVMKIAEQIVVLDAGKLIAQGMPQEIRSNQKVIEAYLGKAEAVSP